MMSIFLSVLLLMGLGSLWRLLRRVVPSAPSVPEMRHHLGSFVLNLLLPALTFSVLATTPITDELWKVPLVASIVCLGTFVFAWASLEVISFLLLKKGIQVAPQTKAVIVLASAWGNVSYLGIPIITSLYGAEYQRIPISVDLLALTPLLWSVGVAIAYHYSISNQHDVSLQDRRLDIVPKSFFHTTLLEATTTLRSLPPIYAVIAGLFVRFLDIPLHPVLISTLHTAGSAVSPIMLISVGMSLQITSLTAITKTLPVIFFKLIFAPIFALVIIHYVGLDTDQNTSSFFVVQSQTARATLTEMAMPTMVITMVIAQRYGLDSELLATIIAVTTLVSMVTIPLILSLV